MATPSVAKKVAALAWSIGLGVVLLALTAKIMFAPPQASDAPAMPGGVAEESAAGNVVAAEGRAAETGSSDDAIMFGSKAPKVTLFNGTTEPQVSAEAVAAAAAVESPLAPEVEPAEAPGPVMFGSKSAVWIIPESSTPPPLIIRDGKLVPGDEAWPAGSSSWDEPTQFDPYSGGLVIPPEAETRLVPPRPAPEGDQDSSPPQQGGSPWRQ